MNSCIEGSSDTWGGRAVSGQALGRPPPTCPVSLWQTRIACLSHLPQVGVPIFILGYRRGAPRKPPWVFPPQTPSPSVPGALPIPCTHAPAILPPMGFPATGDVPLEGAPKVMEAPAQVNKGGRARSLPFFAGWHVNIPHSDLNLEYTKPDPVNLPDPCPGCPPQPADLHTGLVPKVWLPELQAPEGIGR